MLKIITDTQSRIIEDYGPFPLFTKNPFEFPQFISYIIYERDTQEVVELIRELTSLREAGKWESSQVIGILTRLEELRAYDEDLGPSKQEEWNNYAALMPDDIGGPYRLDLKKFLSTKISGEILEAFCGFNSYIFPSANSIVTAQDYSKKMLMKYEHPERRRVLFDWNNIPRQRLSLPDHSFDSIIIVKGYKYINSPLAVFHELKRLLKPSGLLLLVESTTACYPDLAVRPLMVNQCRNELLQTGFSELNINCLPFSYGDGDTTVFFQAKY